MTNNQGQNIVETIRQALNEACTVADSKTIIGEPIVAGGTTLIPVSKVSVGVGIGGGTYGKDTNNGAGGGGTGLTVTPVAFIAVSQNGETKVLNIGAEEALPVPSKISGTVSEIDKALDNVPGIIEKVKGLFKKNKEEASEETEETEVEITVSTESDANVQ